jgi:hypothetical protein
MDIDIEPEETIRDLIKMMRSELGSKSILFAIADEEFIGKEINDITEEIFYEILQEAKPTEEDSEIFLGWLQSFDIYDVQEWEIEPDDFSISTDYQESKHAIWEGHPL